MASFSGQLFSPFLPNFCQSADNLNHFNHQNQNFYK